MKKKGDARVSAAAAALGRIGGSKRVEKGFSSLTPEQRSAMGKAAAAARWGAKATDKVQSASDAKKK